MAFKVVLISNYDDPMIDEVLFTNLNDTTREAAQAIADEYNNDPKNGGIYRKYYAQVKHSDYKLYEFVP